MTIFAAICWRIVDETSHRRIETLLLILAVFIGEAQAQGGLDRDSLAASNCNFR
jgi:hypothetical protein